MRIRSASQSAFDALIDDLFSHEAKLEVSARRPGLSIAGLQAAWGMSPSASSQSAAAAPPRMAEFTSEDGTSQSDEDFDPHEVLEDLGLTLMSTESEILAARREYARRNHPDRLPEALRDLANERMMHVNDLLDRHLKRLRKGGPSR